MRIRQREGVHIMTTLRLVSSFQIPCPKVEDRSSGCISIARRMAQLAHWGHKCMYCQAPVATSGQDMHFDHIVDGMHKRCHHGACHRTWNTGPTCSTCNTVKGHVPGNWVDFARYVAGPDLADQDANIARITSRLYAPVANFESDLDCFIGKAAHMAAYVLTADVVNSRGMAVTFRVAA